MLSVLATSHHLQTRPANVLNSGAILKRPLKAEARSGWLELATVFEKLLGGNPATQRASAYLKALANGELPQHPLHDLSFLEQESLEDIVVAREEPHPHVLAVLCPLVPLRIVGRRGRQ